MSLKTLRMRRSFRGENVEAYLIRQRMIDEFQKREFRELREWSPGRGWGDSYNVDADDRAEDGLIKRIENEVWRNGR